MSGLADAGSKINLYVGNKLCIPVIDFIFISYCTIPDSYLSDGFDGSKVLYCCYCVWHTSNTGLGETGGFAMPVNSAIHRVKDELKMLFKTVA